MNDSERGDWSYIAATILALIMLAVLALAVDAQAMAYARGRVWAAITVAGRAAARCLAPGALAPATTPQACAQTTAQSVFNQNILDDRLLPGVVSTATRLVPPSVSIAATATLSLPFTLPGSGGTVVLTTRVRVSLAVATPGTLP